MSGKQPEALRLANYVECNDANRVAIEAAAELRRLHALNAELVEALRSIVRTRDATKQRIAADLDIAINSARAALAKAEAAQ